jgi:hypothetical protein
MVNTHKHISQNPAILQHPTQEQQPQIPPLGKYVKCMQRTVKVHSLWFWQKNGAHLQQK